MDQTNMFLKKQNIVFNILIKILYRKGTFSFEYETFISGTHFFFI